MAKCAGLLALAVTAVLWGQDQTSQQDQISVQDQASQNQPAGAQADSQQPQNSAPNPALQDPPPVNPPAASQTPSKYPDRDVSLNPKKFAANFFSDQKMIWTFPAKVVTGHDLVPVLAVAAITTGLVFGVDPEEGRYFRRHESTFQPLNDALSEHRTTAASLLIPASLTATGYIAKDKHLAHTGLLALEAWVDVDILDEAIRDAARRERPVNIPPNGNFADTWGKTSGDPLTSPGSFPSGHTGWAFAVATVISRRYPHQTWVHVLSYGLASVDLFSRLSSNSHFLSDSFFGAVLGYCTGRFVVLRQ
jgi:PAP2 superfamily